MSVTSLSFMCEILRAARKAGAGDVHLTAGLPPMMRVNGSLVAMDYSTIMPGDTLDILLNTMTEAQRGCFEERGEYEFAFSVPGAGRCRVNAYRQRGGIAIALRLVNETVPTPEELGLPASVLKLHKAESGLVLMTGPSGSGKSAMLATFVDQINQSREALIITVEDPIEYLQPHKRSMVNQREIGLDSRSCADALQAALREDPDVIVIGELRDPESVAAAVTAAETGHLVLAALSASGVVNALGGIRDMFPPDREERIRLRLAGVLEAVICRRLLPAVSGTGRAAAYEVLLADSVTRRLISEGKTALLADAMRKGAGQGMITMEESVSRLYAEGRIEEKTAKRFIKSEKPNA